jgi:hypothetical protein
VPPHHLRRIVRWLSPAKCLDPARPGPGPAPDFRIGSNVGVPIAVAPGPDGSAPAVPVAVVPQPGEPALLCDLAADGTRLASAVRRDDLSSVIADRERTGRVRWVWASAAGCYPDLLRAGVRVARCHDVALVEALLLGRDGRHGEPATLAAAWARLRGERVPRHAAAPSGAQHAALPSGSQQALFGPDEPWWPQGDATLDALIAVYADQLRRGDGLRRVAVAAGRAR